jgi:DNA-binding NarL/FixJ family response regulator
MNDRPLRVVLADDHPVYRLGLCSLLASVEGMEVVGEAVDGEEAVTAALELRPDVVVMDLQMPGLDGIEATERITQDDPEVAILLLTYTDDDEAVLRALQKGARGYVLKDSGPDVILRAIRDVASGEMIFGASIAKRVGGLLADRPAGRVRPFPDLTDRQYEILELMAQGLNNQRIALQLGVGDKRIRNCVTEIYNKLAVQDRGQAIIRAREAGLGRRPTAGS